jgi:hypothetical protein
MGACAFIVTPIVVIIRVLLTLVFHFVEQMCDLVTSTITKAKNVCHDVCEYFGPLDFFCKVVCKTIEWTETATEWVCTNVVKKAIVMVEVFFEFVLYLVWWACWIVDLPWLLFTWLLCMKGIKGRVDIHLKVKVLADADGVPAVPLADVNATVKAAARIFGKCTITVLHDSTEVIVKPDHLSTNVTFLSTAFNWFSKTASADLCTLTAFIVKDVKGKDSSGTYVVGTNWVVIDASGIANKAPGVALAHEMGHAGGVWSHSDDPDNLMYAEAETGTSLSDSQCCTIRGSKFACLNFGFVPAGAPYGPH